MRLSFLLLLLTLLYSCGADAPPASEDDGAIDYNKALLGTWEIIELSVHVPTYMGQDTTVTERIEEADWSRKYGVKPARTTFTSDGKLRRTHYLVNGQLSDVTNGLWRVQGDSLFFIEPSITYLYSPYLKGEKLELTGRIDWDRDGEADDDYRGSFRLVGRTVE